MSVLRYNLTLPERGIRGFMIENVDSLDGYAVPEHFTNPPIKMTLLKSSKKGLAECFVGGKGTWINQFRVDVLSGKLPFWRLTEVEFHRRSPRLGFRCEDCGIENLYIADDANVTLAFEVYRGETCPPAVYTVRHDWELFGKDDRITYLTSSVEESLNGKVQRLITFDIDRAPRTRTPDYYRDRPERFITIAELC